MGQSGSIFTYRPYWGMPAFWLMVLVLCNIVWFGGAFLLPRSVESSDEAQTVYLGVDILALVGLGGVAGYFWRHKVHLLLGELWFRPKWYVFGPSEIPYKEILRVRMTMPGGIELSFRERVGEQGKLVSSRRSIHVSQTERFVTELCSRYAVATGGNLEVLRI